MVHTNPEFETSNLILDFEFDQHLESHKHMINIIMGFRDMGCYSDDAEGAFGARPSACISNSSPSQVRYKESTPMSQSCNLFSEGSRKRHPRTLGFDDLIHNLQCSGILLIFCCGKASPLPSKVGVPKV
jgi:hypothetical protein